MRASTVGASAHATEAVVNRAEPIRNTRLCPSRSASFPAGTRSAANVIV